MENSSKFANLFAAVAILGVLALCLTQIPTLSNPNDGIDLLLVASPVTAVTPLSASNRKKSSAGVRRFFHGSLPKPTQTPKISTRNSVQPRKYSLSVASTSDLSEFDGTETVVSLSKTFEQKKAQGLEWMKYDPIWSDFAKLLFFLGTSISLSGIAYHWKRSKINPGKFELQAETRDALAVKGRGLVMLATTVEPEIPSHFVGELADQFSTFAGQTQKTQAEAATESDSLLKAERIDPFADPPRRDPNAEEPWIAKQRERMEKQQKEEKDQKDAKVFTRNNEPNEQDWKIRAMACLPYLLPLCDGVRFSQYMFTSFPILGKIFFSICGPALLIFTIPYVPLISFFFLQFKSRDRSIPKFVRFNMQQAVLLDIFIFSSSIIASLTTLGDNSLASNFPDELKVGLTNFAFWAWSVSLLYSVGCNILGKKPDKIPGVSQAADIQSQ